MKKIFNLIQMDITNAIRDNLMLYMIAAPIIIAFLFKLLIFSSVEQPNLTFAVDKNAGENIISTIKKYGKVEIFENMEELEKRVLQNDETAGIIKDGEELVLLLQGNEHEDIQKTYEMVVEYITNVDELSSINVKIQPVDGETSPIYSYIAVILIMMGFLMGGTISGFNIVYEKETKVTRALAISPLSADKMIAARGILAFVLGIFIATISTIIVMEWAVNYWKLICVFAASGILTVLLCLVIGGFANNQINAIAIMKGIVPLYLSFPLISIFVPENVQFVFYPLPSYWQFKALCNVFIENTQGPNFWTSTFLTFVTSVVFSMFLFRGLKNRIQLK